MVSFCLVYVLKFGGARLGRGVGKRNYQGIHRLLLQFTSPGCPLGLANHGQHVAVKSRWRRCKLKNGPACGSQRTGLLAKTLSGPLHSDQFWDQFWDQSLCQALEQCSFLHAEVSLPTCCLILRILVAKAADCLEFFYI